jgi:hypothetical protein
MVLAAFAGQHDLPLLRELSRRERSAERQRLRAVIPYGERDYDMIYACGNASQGYLCGNDIKRT